MKGFNVDTKVKFAISIVFIICLLLSGLALYFRVNYKDYAVNNEEIILYKSQNNDQTVLENGLKKELYISDIDAIKAQTGWGQVKKDEDANGNLITLKIENNLFAFTKGMWAHATSTLVYDLSSYNNYYKYFVAYIGLNKSAASSSNGVKYSFYTSNDNVNWTIYNEPIFKGPGENATLVKVPLNGARYLKLYVDSNGSNGNDHSVYADAKLVTEDYQENNIVLSTEEYDEKIKNFNDKDLSNKEYELLLLQRDFVSCAGRFAIKAYVIDNEDNKNAFNWLFNNVDNLRMYTTGGKPDGSYYNSLVELSKLYKTYKNDFEINDTGKSGIRLGLMYKKMVIALSLSHSSTVALWTNGSAAENKSESVKRYEIYKYLYETGHFKVTNNIDYTTWFENYEVEEYRMIFSNPLDDEEVIWLNERTKKEVDKHPGNEDWYLSPHPYMKYIWPDFNKPEYHDINKKDEWDQKYDFLRYGITFKSGVQKLWMVLENGAVCGGISKIGSNIKVSFGIPSTVVSQPGHAAFIYYNQDANGNGFWYLNNDVYGWAQSGRTERLNIRMPLGFADQEYVDFHKDWLGLATYVLLAQGALNDFDNFEQSREILILADVYKDDTNKLYEIYNDVVTKQPLNIDGWYGLIKTMKNDSTKTARDYLDLAERIFDKLKYYPLPMHHLTREIEKLIKNNSEAYTEFNLAKTRTLTAASKATNSDSIQSGAVRQVANFLLGQFNTKLATFSFDGENKNKLVLGTMYDGIGIRFDYSIDGKKTWREVSIEPTDDHKWLLNDEEINKITSENDIYFHVVGTSYDEDNLYKIDITEGTEPNIYPNDLENKVIGVTDATEWRMSNTDTWTKFSEQLPNLTGDKQIYVRSAATGTRLATKGMQLNFTQDIVDYAHKYVSIERLSISGYSTEQNNTTDAARNVINGRYDDFWHTSHNGSDNAKYITIKVNSEIELSRLVYYPRQDSSANGRILKANIYTSLDGETWEILAENVVWANNKNAKTIDFETPKKTLYVKIVGVETYGSYASSAQIELYENGYVLPTANVTYDITEQTTNNVIATIANLSSDTTVIGDNTHIFTSNGTYTFTIENTITKVRNYIIATVDWITKDNTPVLPVVPSEPSIPEVPSSPEVTPSITETPNSSSDYQEETSKVKEENILTIKPTIDNNNKVNDNKVTESKEQEIKIENKKEVNDLTQQFEEERKNKNKFIIYAAEFNIIALLISGIIILKNERR